MPGPLHGLTMIEATTWGMGPIGGLMLGDLGADIIKIESPTRPDAARHVTDVAGINNLMPDGRSAAFQSFNRNKRSLALDLKSEEGREIFKSLITETDIFLENYRPGAFDKLGLGYDVLGKINPGLIYASTSGYGFRGAEANKPALDAVGQARSGFMYSGGGPGEPPNWNTLAVADVMGATCVAYGVLAAVVHRERSGGRGQKVEVSHINANMWLSYWGVAVSMLMGYDEWPRFDRERAGNPLWNLYACAQDEWIMLGIIDSTRHWPEFCDVMELPDLLDEPRFDTMENRYENREALVRLLDARFAELTVDEWSERFDRRPDLIYSRVQRFGDLPNDPAVIANQYLVDHQHRDYGPIKALDHPVRLSDSPASIRRDAPELGEHSAAVLKERLGLNDDQIAELVANGVVA